MIESVIIKDNTNSLVDYLEEVELFENNKEFKFKPGINIVVGPNGCGKSTLLNLISKYCLCDKTMYSKILSDPIEYLDYFDYKTGNFKDGVSVKGDYRGIVYKMQEKVDNSNGNLDINNFTLLLDSRSSSTGESILNSLSSLFDIAFGNKVDINFPLDRLKELIEDPINDNWRENCKKVLKYYLNNSISNINSSNFEFTFLLDEPDRNLDIDNINMVYDILSHRKERAQLICTIHNPILIYKLSKLNYINFIELEEGYINKIKELIENV